MNLKKPISLFIYFMIFLVICVFLFKDTEAFKSLQNYITTTTTTNVKNINNHKPKPTITKSACATFIEEAENGKYDDDYNECYSECVYNEPSGDARIYCGMGSECDAFCFNQT